MHKVLSENLEVNDAGSVGPGRLGEVRYLKRVTRYMEMLPETSLPGFFWKSDVKNIKGMPGWAKKSEGKPAPTLGARAAAAILRTALDPLLSLGTVQTRCSRRRPACSTCHGPAS